MGWLSEQVQMPDSNRPEWKPVFAALTDKDILLYDMVPNSCDDWNQPYISHPLLATRLVEHSCAFFNVTTLCQSPTIFFKY